MDILSKAQFREIRSGRRTRLEMPGAVPTDVRSAPSYRGAISREALAAASTDEEAALIRGAAEDESDALKPSERRQFDGAFAGRVDVDHHLADYLAKADLAPKTVKERGGLVGQFASWCKDRGVKLDRVDRRIAGQYVSDEIDPRHPATQNKHLTALRGYWDFLAQRGHIELPAGIDTGEGWPWKGQQLAKRGKRVSRGTRQEPERAFGDAEVQRLLGSPFPMKPAYEEPMTDLLRISLLSGMRLAEIVTLWVEEVREGDAGAGLVFDLQEAKSEAGARQIPVHPALSQVVERRTRGKAAGEWLFHEAWGMRDPGDTYGKRFARWRKAVGVHEQREGVRRSLVNFHSARRWFATAAARAGVHDAVIKDVIGHKPDKSDVTRRSYIARSSGAQLRECVEAVRLPSL